MLNINGKNHTGLATHFSIGKQTSSNKFYRESFSVKDFVKLAEYTESGLSFVFPAGNRIIIDSNDLKIMKEGNITVVNNL